MTDIKRHIISCTATVLDAVRMLNDISADLSLTLFVVDQSEGGRMIGTITDGDVRRALAKDCGLECSVEQVMNKKYTVIPHGVFNADILQYIKANKFKLVPVLNDSGCIVRVLNFSEGRSFLPLDAVLMAGGKGERLRPMTLTTPKPLLKVGDKPIIDYNIDNLLHHGIENINVTINYLGEQIEAHFSEPIGADSTTGNAGVQVKCVREPKYLGTMGSIKFVQQWHNDTILVMNSDLFTNIDLEDFFFHFKKHDADMSIAAVPYSVNVPYGIFELTGTRDIKGVKEKPSFHYYANAGIYLIKKSVLEAIPDGEFFNATDLMELLISQNKSVIRFPLAGYWIDIGKPEDFKKVQDLANHMHK